MSQNSEPRPVQENDPKEMQIVPATYNTTPFQLPPDWVVEIRPRGPTSCVSSDKYYYEPGTGRKFRSLASVRRYLYGEADPPPMRKPSRPSRPNNCLVPYDSTNKPGTVERISYGGKILTPEELEEARYTNLEDIKPETSQFRLANTLPDGWIIKDVPRKEGSTIRSDRYYIDPATGQRFRSMPEVQRFLEGQRCKPKRKALVLNTCKAPRSSISRKKNTSITTFKDTLLDQMYPPKKINWVYSGDGRDNWSPLVEECVLPSYVMEQWSETFLLGMNVRKDCVPQLTMEEHNQG